MGVSDIQTDNSLFFGRDLHSCSDSTKTPPHFLADFEANNTQNNKRKDKQAIGRFAPSPTGPLHFGSLIAAVASYLNVKTKPNGKWLLRIEDLDIHREIKGATDSIIKTLETYGFEWDDEIIYQSDRNDYYRSALEILAESTYACSCSRKDLQALSTTEHKYTIVYPGLCRKKPLKPNADQLGIRLLTNNKEICFQDLCQPNPFCQNIEKEVGDFILKRRDGLYAYQLAVVVDDALQQISEVVRGADLFDNTPRQIYLQQLLNIPTPDYLHFPVAITEDGKKLSKQNGSPEIGLKNKRKNLTNALNFLGMTPPHFSTFFSLNDCWDWAIKHWDSAKIPKTLTQHYEP